MCWIYLSKGGMTHARRVGVVPKRIYPGFSMPTDVASVMDAAHITVPNVGLLLRGRLEAASRWKLIAFTYVDTRKGIANIDTSL